MGIKLGPNFLPPSFRERDEEENSSGSDGRWGFGRGSGLLDGDNVREKPSDFIRIRSNSSPVTSDTSIESCGPTR